MKFRAVLIATASLAAFSLDAQAAELPAQPGEDLLTALRRVHPCFDAPGVRIPSQVMSDNPERVGPGGRMVLAHATIQVPDAFLDKAQCTAQVQEPAPTAAEAAPPSPPAPVEPPPALAPTASAPEGHAVSAKNETAPHDEVNAHFRKGPQHRPHEEEAKPEGHAEHATEDGAPYESRISIAGLLAYSRLAPTIYSTGSQPTLTSHAEPGFELELSHELTHHWELGFGYRYLHAALNEPEGIEFSELSTTFHELMLSAAYRLTHRSWIKLEAGAAQVDELHNLATTDEATGETVNTLVLDHAFRLSTALSFHQQIARVHETELAGSLGVQTFLPIGNGSQMGLGETLRFTAEREISRRLSIELGLWTTYERQATTSESHSVVTFGGTLGASYGF